MALATLQPVLLKVSMAGIDFGVSPDELETLLGSCVGVAIWDRTTGLGGLAHVVLPESNGGRAHPGKYADTAIAEMRRRLIAEGGNPLGFVAKIAGGSTMFGIRSERDIGTRNCQAVKAGLETHRIKLAAEHVGGNQGRVVRFSLRDGSLGVTIGRVLVAVI